MFTLPYLFYAFGSSEEIQNAVEDENSNDNLMKKLKELTNVVNDLQQEVRQKKQEKEVRMEEVKNSHKFNTFNVL